MFTVSLIESSKRVQNEISAKVMPKPQNLTAGAALRAPRAFRDKLVARLLPPDEVKVQLRSQRDRRNRLRA
jgi:hypothetical protein